MIPGSVQSSNRKIWIEKTANSLRDESMLHARKASTPLDIAVLQEPGSEMFRRRVDAPGACQGSLTCVRLSVGEAMGDEVRRALFLVAAPVIILDAGPLLGGSAIQLRFVRTIGVGLAVGALWAGTVAIRWWSRFLIPDDRADASAVPPPLSSQLPASPSPRSCL